MVYDKIMQKYSKIKNIEYANALANWDQSTYMPQNGINSRVEVSVTLSEIAYDLIISDELNDLLNNITESGEYVRLDDRQKSEINTIKRIVDRERKIPKLLNSEIARVTTLAMSVWEEAKKDGDDREFLPLLKRIVKLKKEYASSLGYESNPYDALLDCYDRGLRYQYIEPLFNNLKESLIQIINKVYKEEKDLNQSILQNNFDKQKQWDFGLEIVKEMGLDTKAFRQDISIHPFTTKLGHNDIRITTDIKEDNFLKGFYSTIHEAGHALYEQSVSQYFSLQDKERLIESPLASLDSLALHESQSRFYENIICRSKKFWKGYFSKLKSLFEPQFSQMDYNSFYEVVNRVEVSPIRIEADEVTYNLHIILRTEIENKLINDSLDVNDLETFWNDKTKEIFGFTPKNKSEGYLQDIHWSSGLIGYFPTYTLGNLISAQFYNEVRSMIDQSEVIDKELFNSLKEWFTKHLTIKVIRSPLLRL